MNVKIDIVTNSLKTLVLTGLWCVLGISSVAAQSGVPPTDEGDQWDYRFGVPGVVGEVNAIAVNGSDVYIGGRFTIAGTLFPHNVVHWDGSQWSYMGPSGARQGVDGQINAIAVQGDNVYVGGSFSTAGGVPANNIAVWNRISNTWSALGYGVGDLGEYVSAITVHGNDVYVGGNFTIAGSMIAYNIARWDGASWSRMSGGTNGEVSALAYTSGALYVGGTFTMADLVPVSNIARWDGAAWSALGSGADNTVHVLYPEGDSLFVGGMFTHAGGLNSRLIAVYHPSTNNWTNLAAQIPPNTGSFSAFDIQSVARFRGNLVIAGGLEHYDPFHSHGTYLYEWNGTSWSQLDLIAGGSVPLVHALASHNGGLLMGGIFENVRLSYAYSIANFDGSGWKPLGTGVYCNVNALANDGKNIYIGSHPTLMNYGNIPMGNTPPMFAGAEWDGNNWEVFNDKFGPGNYPGNPAIRSIVALPSSEIVYAGRFGKVGNLSCDNMAVYTNGAWSPLAGGVNSNVNSMCLSANRLFVAGEFSTAGGAPAKRVAAFNLQTRTWEYFNGGPNGAVNAVAADGELVYVGGQFDSAGTVAVKNIAVYNRTTGMWNALKGGTSGPVYALSIIPEDRTLFVGGTFDYVDGQKAGNFAIWRNDAWEYAKFGVNGRVNTLLWDGSVVFLGGSFNRTGDSVLVNNIARWNGRDWSSLGSGCNNTVRAITIIENDLYIGGDFTAAGGKPAYRFTRYNRFFAGVGTEHAVTGLRSLQVFPNPADDRVRIQWLTELRGAVSLTVCDMYGRVVLEQSLSAGTEGAELNTGTMSSGQYILRLNVGNAVSVARITILH